MNSGRKEAPASEVGRLIVLWGACCLSPLLYLATTAIIRKSLMDGNGFWPMAPDIWKNALMGLGVWVVLLQVVHLGIKRKYIRRLTESASDTTAYMRLLTRRTIILISLSELAVFAGFCLFMFQGDVTPVFGGGVAAMLLYAQSHPLSANGMMNREKKP